MAFIPGINQIYTNFDLTLFGEGVSFGLWFDGAAPATIGDLTALNTALILWYQVNLTPLHSNQMTFNGVTSYAMDALDAPRVATPITPVPGTFAGPALDLNTAMVISLSTDNRGRSGRGRVYFPGLVEGTTDTGIFTTTWRDDVRQAFEALAPEVTPLGLTHIVSSAYFNNAPRVQRLAQPVVQYVAKAKPGTQRRRVRYGDGNP